MWKVTQTKQYYDVSTAASILPISTPRRTDETADNKYT